MATLWWRKPGAGGPEEVAEDNPLPVQVRDAAGNERGLNVDASGQIAVTVATLPTYSVAGHGEVAGSATAAAFPDSVACKFVEVKAQYNNAGRVYVGTNSGITVAAGTSDTTTGMQLNPGESIVIWVSNVNLVYRICDNAGDDVTYIAYT